jgi:hypothetical protein
VGGGGGGWGVVFFLVGFFMLGVAGCILLNFTKMMQNPLS